MVEPGTVQSMRRKARGSPPSQTIAGAQRSARSNRRTDTKPEVRLRSELHRRGLRFRKDYPLRLNGKVVARPDVVFTRRRVVVFIDGCFWRCCREHGSQPKSNTEYWGPKLKANRVRDAGQTRTLTDQGWTVLRFWEHEAVAAVADNIAQHVRTRDESIRSPAAS